MTGVSAMLSMVVSAELSVTASPPSLSTASASDPFTTRSCTGIVSGGSGTYTYAWTIVSQSGADFSALSPTSATTSFRIADATPGDFSTATARLTVTDGISGQSAHVDVSLTHHNIIIF